MLLYIAIYVDIAAVSTKPIRQGQKALAGLVSETASAALAGKSHSKKKSRKEILLSEDDSVPGGEKTLTIQMQHTIGRGTSKDDDNTSEAVKSLFDEVKSRKDLISQLEDLQDPFFEDEILTNKRRIIEVSPIFNYLCSLLKYTYCIVDLPQSNPDSTV